MVLCWFDACIDRTLYTDGAGVLVYGHTSSPGRVFRSSVSVEFASATICALAFDSQLEPECTESEGSRKSGSAILMDAQNPVYDEAGA